jgi:hypothetical protein
MFYANDSLGNLGFKDINISKDTTVPKITINSPTPNQSCGVDAPVFLNVKTLSLLLIISISSFLVSIYEWLIYINLFGFDIVVLGIYFVYFIPFAIIVGGIIGFAY